MSSSNTSSSPPSSTSPHSTSSPPLATLPSPDSRSTTPSTVVPPKTKLAHQPASDVSLHRIPMWSFPTNWAGEPVDKYRMSMLLPKVVLWTTTRSEIQPNPPLLPPCKEGTRVFHPSCVKGQENPLSHLVMEESLMPWHTLIGYCHPELELRSSLNNLADKNPLQQKLAQKWDTRLVGPESDHQYIAERIVRSKFIEGKIDESQKATLSQFTKRPLTSSDYTSAFTKQFNIGSLSDRVGQVDKLRVFRTHSQPPYSYGCVSLLPNCQDLTSTQFSIDKVMETARFRSLLVEMQVLFDDHVKRSEVFLTEALKNNWFKHKGDGLSFICDFLRWSPVFVIHNVDSVMVLSQFLVCFIIYSHFQSDLGVSNIQFPHAVEMIRDLFHKPCCYAMASGGTNTGLEQLHKVSCMQLNGMLNRAFHCVEKLVTKFHVVYFTEDVRNYEVRNHESFPYDRLATKWRVLSRDGQRFPNNLVEQSPTASELFKWAAIDQFHQEKGVDTVPSSKIGTISYLSSRDPKILTDRFCTKIDLLLALCDDESFNDFDCLCCSRKLRLDRVSQDILNLVDSVVRPDSTM